MPALKAAVTADATGYCAYTPNLPGDCLSSAKGSWPLTARESFTTIDDCQWRCTQCRNCNFVSASEKHGECQWYKECRVADLQVSELGLAYRTRQVSVHTPHSATDQPGACSQTKAQQIRPIWRLLTPNASSDCASGSRGGWAHVLSMDACEARCEACERCHFFSFSRTEAHCAWFRHCDLERLELLGEGRTYLTRRSRAIAAEDPALAHSWDPAARPAALGSQMKGRRTSTVAIQVSGHLQAGCRFDSLVAHVRACRARFEHCRIYMHTWSTLAPSTPHWSGKARHRGAQQESSRACVRRVRKVLAPDALVVEVQPPMPPPAQGGGATPDGQPFLSRHREWGAGRHFGWRQNVGAMGAAGALRRAAANESHALVVRLRPDGMDYASFGNDRKEKMQLLWACIAMADAAASSPAAAGNDAARRLQAAGTRALVSCNPDGGAFQDGRPRRRQLLLRRAARRRRRARAVRLPLRRRLGGVRQALARGRARLHRTAAHRGGAPRRRRARAPVPAAAHVLCLAERGGAGLVPRARDRGGCT